MSKVKKIIAVILATLMLMSVSVFSSSAAVNAPEFKVTLVSETATTVVVAGFCHSCCKADGVYNFCL